MISGLKYGTNLYRFPGFGPDLAPLIEFVKLSESAGFDRIRLLDHVVGIAVEKHGGIAKTPYTQRSIIRECFTMMAYLTGITSRITFMTGVLGLPQRQAVLVAKQAAEIDILSGGRIMLGVGVGYNPLEFEAMGEDFATRGKRFEEQVNVMRMLWTQEEVSFEGNYHTLRNVSLSPMLGKTIPLYFGLGRKIAPIPPDVVLKRIGRMADGWLPIFKPSPEGDAAIATVRAAAVEAGRNPDDIMMDITLDFEHQNAVELGDQIKALRDFGAHAINFSLSGANSAEHIEMLKRLCGVLNDTKD